LVTSTTPMSKAFTRESDAGDDESADGASEDGAGALPAGTRNYMTPQGHARLRQEWTTLMDQERPRVVEAVHWAAKNGDRSENGDYLYGKKRLREIDRRIRFLTRRLELAEVADPSVHHGGDQVFFGATVTYAEADGTERTVTILGIDEADSLKGQVSWVAPVARALLKARVGDAVRLVTPAGVQTLDVLSVSYPAP
jgi:transcription elongation factor GreB